VFIGLAKMLRNVPTQFRGACFRMLMDATDNFLLGYQRLLQQDILPYRPADIEDSTNNALDDMVTN